MAIDGVQNAFQASFQSAGPSAADREQGVFMGHTVDAMSEEESLESLLADAAEELTFSVDTTDEFELRECKQREKALAALADRVQLYRELMSKTGKTKKSDELKVQIRTRKGPVPSYQKLKAEIPDPSDAWSLFKDLEWELEESNDPDDKKTLKEVKNLLQELEEKDGPAIRAGIQGVLSSAGYEDIGTPDVLGDVYRNTVGEFSSPNEVFASIKEKFGSNFDRAMDYLFSALSSDIASDVPSMGLTHLEAVHETLGQVRLTKSAYTQCSELLDRWDRIHGVKPDPAQMDAMSLLESVLSLREQRFVGKAQIDAITAKSGAPDIEHEVLFVQELFRAVRNFPSALFNDDEGRMKIFNAVQEAVDAAIEREDEMLAQEEN